MKKDPKERFSSQRRDDPGISAERLTCGVTGGDVGTIIGICVAFLIVSAGLTAYVICISLLILLARVSASHFRPL